MSASGSGLKHPFPIYQRVKDNVSTNPGQMPTYERRLGDNEVYVHHTIQMSVSFSNKCSSYYLPSRASGVNDMYRKFDPVDVYTCLTSMLLQFISGSVLLQVSSHQLELRLLGL